MKKTIQHHSRGLPLDYPTFLREIKTRIRATQVRASLAANAELIRLYWDIGRSIIQRQKKEKWGSAVIEKLAVDLQREFAGLGGFSRVNIWRMRAFYLAYSHKSEILSQPAREIPSSILSQPVRQLGGVVPPQIVMELPWFHNVVLVEQVKDPVERFWYAQKSIEHGWSRPILEHQIESGLFQRQGKAITNFKAALPPPQSDLAPASTQGSLHLRFSDIA